MTAALNYAEILDEIRDGVYEAFELEKDKGCSNTLIVGSRLKDKKYGTNLRICCALKEIPKSKRSFDLINEIAEKLGYDEFTTNIRLPVDTIYCTYKGEQSPTLLDDCIRKITKKVKEPNFFINFNSRNNERDSVLYTTHKTISPVIDKGFDGFLDEIKINARKRREGISSKKSEISGLVKKMQEMGLTKHQRLKELNNELKEMSRFTLKGENMHASYEIDTEKMEGSYEGELALSDGSLPSDVGDIVSIEEKIFGIQSITENYEQYIKMVIPEGRLADKKEIADLVYKYFSSGIRIIS